VLQKFAGFDASDGRLFTPIDVAAERGVDVFVLDGSSGRVIRFDRELRGQSVIFDGGGDRSGGFAPYAGIALDHESGDLLLSDRSEGVLTRLDFTGRASQVAGGFGSVKKSLRDPAGLDVAPDGAVFVADRGMKAVAYATRFGADIRLIGAGLFTSPVDATAFPDNRIAVADAYGLVVFDRAGTALGSAGFGAEHGISPRSIAFHDGHVYVADARSKSILVYRIETPEPR
jgi:DNA-binding beta-propeller fold protein YncE